MMSFPDGLGTSGHSAAYRQRETRSVLQAWDAGLSVSILGVGSAGKSNFVQHLATLGAASSTVENWPNGLIPIVIDANMLGPLPETGDPAHAQMAFWAGCELMLHRVFMALYPFEGFSGDERTTLYQAYEALQDGGNPLVALLSLRYLELGLSVPLRKGLRIAFIFDEFEQFAALLPVGFFQALRGLRDLYKRQLTLATVSRGQLPEVIEQAGMNALEAEPFVELFADNVVYISTFDRIDAEAMVSNLLVRRGAVMHASAIAALLECTGGHPGLLRAAVGATLDRPALGKLPPNSLSPALLAVLGVQQECAAIWGSLPDTERAALTARLQRQQGDASAILVLQRKGLLGSEFEITPPLFVEYVAAEAAS